MFHLLLSILVVGSTIPLATTLPPHWGVMRVKHAWNTVPEDWVCLGHPPAEASIDLHIALKSQHENALTDALYEVITPGHPKYVFHYFACRGTHVYHSRYGEHLSKEQIAKLVAPHADTLELVGSCLSRTACPLLRSQ